MMREEFSVYDALAHKDGLLVDYQDALKRAVETNLRCAAALWLRNTKTGEPYEWTTCELAPHHDCLHATVDRDGNRWVEWDDGVAPSRHAEAFHHTEPSPWLSGELAALASVGGTYSV